MRDMGERRSRSEVLREMAITLLTEKEGLRQLAHLLQSHPEILLQVIGEPENRRIRITIECEVTPEPVVVRSRAVAIKPPKAAARKASTKAR
jgi:hypothetical protein